jgi:RNA polymerase sigma factor (sigma-70 family)
LEDIKKLYQLYSKDIFKYLASLTMNSHVAEDILQSTFLAAIRSLKTFRGQSSVKTWLIGIARNEYYTYQRKNPSVLPIDEAIDVQDRDVFYYEHIKYSYEDALAEISKLPEPLRQIMILRLVNELSFSEIASIVNKSEVYCRVSFYRGKTKLSEVLKDE